MGSLGTRALTCGDAYAVVKLPKGNLFCPARHIQSYAVEVFGRLARADQLHGLDRDDFAGGLATFYGDLNALHPFREWNGRAQRAFTSQLAHDAGWHTAWDRLDPKVNIAASKASFAGDMAPLRAIFGAIVEQRQATAPPVEKPAHRQPEPQAARHTTEPSTDPESSEPAMRLGL